MKGSQIFAWTCIFLVTFGCTLFTVRTARASEPRGSDEVSKVDKTTTPPARSGSVHKPPVKNKHWNEKTKVWLARSCVGESGFTAVDECMAIAWIYAKRSHLVRWSLLKMIRRYSAATKPHEVHRRPWLFELTAKAEKPEHWPDSLRWKRHKKAWLNLLSKLDEWKRGGIPDPLPEADHYGSYRDANQSRYVRTWERLDAPGFKNLYFNSRQRQRKPVSKYTKYMINGRH